MKKAKIDIDSGASTINVKAGENDNLLFYGNHLSNFFNLNQSVQVVGSEAKVDLKTSPVIKTIFAPKSINELNLAFSKIPTYSFDINTGVSNLSLDFSGLNVENFEVKGGASKISLKLGEKSTEGKIQVGASSINIDIPANIGIRIKSKSAFASNNFEEAGLAKNDSVWESVDWDKSSSKIDLEINAGASNVKVNKY